MTACPKCGVAVTAKALECPRCGVVFAKLREPALEAPRQSAVATPPRPADPTEPFVRGARWITIAVLTWLTWQFAASPLAGEDRAVMSSFLHLPNLIFHEAGHMLFMPFGRFMTVLGGSLFQILVPLIIAVGFVYQHHNQGPQRADFARGGGRNWFGCAVMIWWAGQNFVDVAPYIADARKLQLTLIGGKTGAEVEGHDWEYLLTALGWLHRDVTLGRAAHVLGTIIMIAALVWAVTLVARRQEQSLDT